jgi:hypothetical protein
LKNQTIVRQGAHPEDRADERRIRDNFCQAQLIGCHAASPRGSSGISILRFTVDNI